MNLREGGIYRLPNGRELVIKDKDRKGSVLFRLGGWKRFEGSEYEINSEGRLLAHGKLTACDIADLTDTGRTVDDPRFESSANDGDKAGARP